MVFTRKEMYHTDNSVIKRHCGTLPREEGGLAEAKRYKGDLKECVEAEGRTEAEERNVKQKYNRRERKNIPREKPKGRRLRTEVSKYQFTGLHIFMCHECADVQRCETVTQKQLAELIVQISEFGIQTLQFAIRIVWLTCIFVFSILNSVLCY